MAARWSSALAAAAVASALLCACTNRDTRHGTAAEPRAALENPSDFPLYPNSAVVSVVPIDSAQIVAAMRKNDPNAQVPRGFRGHEVIVENAATLSQLGGWIRRLKSSPPDGFHVMSHDDGINIHVGAAPKRDSEVAAQFESRDGARAIYIVAGDPRRIRDELGPVFALMDSYSAVPGVVRGPIDDQAKQQFGYSVTEMLDPRSPVGAVVAAVKRLSNTDRRAILLIDETKTKSK